MWVNTLKSRLHGLLVYGLSMCCYIVLTSTVAAAPTVDAAVLRELRESAVQEWQAVEQGFQSIDVTFRESYKKGPAGNLKLESEGTRRLAYDINRRVTLFRAQSDQSPESMGHTVANSKYDFEVYTPDMEKRGTLQKLNLVTNDGSGSGRENGLPTWGEQRLHLLSSCRLAGMPLAKLLDSREFEPMECIATGELGQRRIQFSAQYKKAQPGPDAYSMILDPSHHYRVLSWVIDIAHGERHEIRNFEYFNEVEVYIPRKIVTASISKTQCTERTLTYELPKPWSIPDAEFYLPHYGFSESVLETLHPNPWPRWLLIGFGVLTIAIGAWLVRGRRQPAA